jgi:hypothetical protein
MASVVLCGVGYYIQIIIERPLRIARGTRVNADNINYILNNYLHVVIYYPKSINIKIHLKNGISYYHRLFFNISYLYHVLVYDVALIELACNVTTDRTTAFATLALISD